MLQHCSGDLVRLFIHFDFDYNEISTLTCCYGEDHYYLHILRCENRMRNLMLFNILNKYLLINFSLSNSFEI